MKRRELLISTAIVAAAVIVGTAFGKPAKGRPNIVWIFSDDHAAQAVGAYGSRLQKLDPTPNIDRIAKEGMRFDRMYVGNSICAPSRATLLTGKHSHLNGLFRNGPPFDHDQQQFQKILQKNGYQTAMIGKIHLSGAMQGFDYWDVLPGQGNYYQPDFIGDDGRKTIEGYVTDVITDRSLDWLSNQRDKSKPFMLMIHHKAPHRSWCPAIRHISKYHNVEIPVPDNLLDDYSTRGTAAREQHMNIKSSMNLRNDLKMKTKEERIKGLEKAKTAKYRPGGERGIYYRMTDEQRKAWDAHYDPKIEALYNNKPEGDELVKWKYQRYMEDYLATIYGVDENVGRVLEQLEKEGLADNTVVIYSSDQGFYLGEHGWFDKRFMYEESFKTPFVVRWPGVIKPGTVNDDLCQNIDWAETFLDIAGAPIPDDMQGESLVPLMKRKKFNKWRKSLYYRYYEFPGCHSVRLHEGVATDRYKLIRFFGPKMPNGEEWELYDLKHDPHEMNNVYRDEKQKKRISELKEELSRLRQYYKVPPDKE